MATRHDLRRSGAAATIGIVALLAVMALVMMLAERGAFKGLGMTTAMVAPPIPGLTLDDDPADRVPVVTSLQTHSEAERRGVRVGDRIEAVDGRQVRDLTTLRAVVAKHSGAAPVSLEIQRGDALWNVALDRAEP